MLRGILGTGGSAPVGGSGTSGTIPVWSSGTTLGDSPLTVSGTTVTATQAFTVNGTHTFNGNLVSGFNQTWTLNGGFLNIQSGLLYLDKTNSRIGIGTASPGAKLHIGSGSYAGTSLDGVRLTNGINSYYTASDGTRTSILGADGNAFVGTLTNHSFVIRSNNTNAITIDTAQNVGINEPSPSTYGKLAITVGTTTLALNADATRADVQSYNKPLAINRLGNNTLMNEGGGSVGIGTASPFTRTDSLSSRSTAFGSIASFNTMPLSVTDDTAFAIGVGGGINFRAKLTSSTYATYAALWSARETATNSDYRGSLVFATADNANGYPSERARIDSSGRLLVGTATSPTSSAAKLVVNAAGGVLQYLYDSTASRGAYLNAYTNTLEIGGVTGALGTESTTTWARVTSTALDASFVTGYGLKLPATNGTTYNTDPNTLDCYAEKDLTATMTCGTSGTITLSTNTLKFTRIGRVVTIVGRLVIGSVSSPVGRLTINTGVGANEYPATYAAAAVFPSGWAAGFGGAPSAVAIPGGSTVYLDRFGSGGVVTDVASYAQAGAEVSISITYVL